MSLILTDNFIAGALGTTALFKDTTGTTAANGYGKSGNITYSDVDAIRLKVATLSSIENVETLSAGDAFTLYTEYLCTAGTGTIDGKALSPGEYFVPNTTYLSVGFGMEFETTGNYIYPYLATWLPTATEVPLTISLANLGQSGNTTMEDSLYTLNYEVYIDKFSSSQVSVSGYQYIVMSGSCAYDGSTYKAGEIFTAIDTTSIAIVTGEVAILSATITTYFVVTYNMIKDIFEILPIADYEVSQEIYQIRVQLEALSFSAATGNVSFTYTQGLLNTLQGKVTYLQNNN